MGHGHSVLSARPETPISIRAHCARYYGNTSRTVVNPRCNAGGCSNVLHCSPGVFLGAYFREVRAFVKKALELLEKPDLRGLVSLNVPEKFEWKFSKCSGIQRSLFKRAVGS